jgi:Icc-related predicted phosphoesterase
VASKCGDCFFNSKIALIGHDGWYDGGYANWFKSEIVLTDYVKIKELAVHYKSMKELCFQEMQKMAKQSADYFEENIKLAFKEHDKVYLVTHVPPFKESSRNPFSNTGELSDPDWMPHMSSKASGDAILRAMENISSNKHLIVLCGHTHAESSYNPTASISCYTGHAEYYKPKVNGVFLL